MKSFLILFFLCVAFTNTSSYAEMSEEQTDTNAYAEMSEEQTDTNAYAETSEQQDVEIDLDMVIEQIKIMQRQESVTYGVEYYFPEDIYDDATIGEFESQINPRWRERICEWAFKVVDHYDFKRNVAAFAIKILDRYLAETKISTKKEFQLAAASALYFAIKTQEAQKLGIEAMVQLNKGKFDSKDIAEEEMTIMKTLKYWLNPPLEDDYLLRFMKLINTDRTLGDLIYEKALFDTELSLCDSFFITSPAASVAFAALVNAIELTYFSYFEHNYKRNEFYQKAAREFGLVYNSLEIVELRSRLQLLFNNTNSGA